jgi:hypothetical protein
MNYLEREITKAELQGNKQVVKEGLVIALKRNGKVLRRGIGLPPWKQLIDELEGVIKDK